ncbi:ArsR/SmtB family transcription factor [Paenibacillus sp. DYY-L-2]|uniref:ArsR/SmtB family transcription factor n=1 Tax=Paenibacillus sp. DYY-L-2 TaxID=3447013 RepID=UPI003F4F9A66
MDEMITILKLLADKTRLTILAILKDGERCVCDLVEALQTTQPNISQHLRKLRAAGLVQETRRGQWAYYRLTVDDKPYVQAVMEAVALPQELRKSLGRCADDNCCT